MQEDQSTYKKDRKSTRTLNIYVFLMVPGLSGGIGTTVMIRDSANERMASARESVANSGVAQTSKLL